MSWARLGRLGGVLERLGLLLERLEHVLERLRAPRTRLPASGARLGRNYVMRPPSAEPGGGGDARVRSSAWPPGTVKDLLRL